MQKALLPLEIVGFARVATLNGVTSSVNELKVCHLDKNK